MNINNQTDQNAYLNDLEKLKKDYDAMDKSLELVEKKTAEICNRQQSETNSKMRTIFTHLVAILGLK